MDVSTKTIEERYLELNPRSRADFVEASKYLPGGHTRSSVAFPPYHLYMDHAEGCYMWDVDGNKRIDFLSNYTSLILGHRHPKVMEAVSRQLEKGTAYGAPSEEEIKLARLLVKRVPSIDKIRFTNSGTEATMFAIRAARAFTGRDKVAKFEGGYHGSHDAVDISVHPDLSLAGPRQAPLSLPDAEGILEAMPGNVVILPYNDQDACEKLIVRHKDELACVIIEPMLGSGGAIPAEPSFLRFLREITRQYGIVLIFDEVISFRLSPGGVQELHGAVPDLTSLGKIIGGGFPVGAFGGRREIMALFDTVDGVCRIPQAGTFNGNPIGVAAGYATMNELTPEVYRKLNENGDYLRTRLAELFERKGAEMQVTGMGSIFNLHLTRRKITDYRSSQEGVDRALKHRVFLSLLEHGVFTAERLMGCTSVPMARAELDAFVDATEAMLRDI
ncbi:MAG: glutamate-1-semialdehyde 2,1-aminomutase [Chloroflexi bacterium]|nr:glutamate-1-semialdehyde 2,1-aminomutase [Chloroflexota bacterium]